MTPQAIFSPEFPEGCVVKSSGTPLNKSHRIRTSFKHGTQVKEIGHNIILLFKFYNSI